MVDTTLRLVVKSIVVIPRGDELSNTSGKISTERPSIILWSFVVILSDLCVEAIRI